jgi:hypothetical protein
VARDSGREGFVGEEVQDGTEVRREGRCVRGGVLEGEGVLWEPFKARSMLVCRVINTWTESEFYPVATYLAYA